MSYYTESDLNKAKADRFKYHWMYEESKRIRDRFVENQAEFLSKYNVDSGFFEDITSGCDSNGIQWEGYKYKHFCREIKVSYEQEGYYALKKDIENDLERIKEIVDLYRSKEEEAEERVRRIRKELEEN